MKKTLKSIVETAVARAHAAGVLPSGEIPEVEIEEPKINAHGDFSSNIAMVSARIQKMAPRQIAQAVIDHLEDPNGVVEKMEIAGPGFLNFFIRTEAWHPVLETVHREDDRYGRSDMGKGVKVQVEFVSSNPTGPLHVGHGRGAAVGDSLANLLSRCGYDVQKEYYINDSGRQIETLGRSVYLRYLEGLGKVVDFPDTCYQGDYIRQLADTVAEQHGPALAEGDEAGAVEICARFAAQEIIAGIRKDLEAFGVTFDRWFSEQSLYTSGRVDAAIETLKKNGLAYEEEGALWFASSRFGDEKDRVVVRKNGQTTYFASDIAYHKEKFERGFDKVIDVWGADHHGYIPRMKAAVEACGTDRDRFDVVLVQLVNLLRDGQPVAMSTRAGEFETLEDVVSEVGADAARFIFLTRHYESPLDFDLELAKKKTNDNPVYYVQYVHARISSIKRKGRERNIDVDAIGPADAAVLKEPEEIQLIKAVARYPEVLALGARNMEPHRVTFYLMELAQAFHAYYNKHRVLDDDPALTRGRLYLVSAVQKVIRNGLNLLGVSAPESM